MAPDGQRRGSVASGFSRTPRLRVLISDERGRSIRRAALAGWLSRVAPASARGVVCIALVSDRRMRALNRQFRRKDAVTDVLSFRTKMPPQRTRRSRRSRRGKHVPSSVSSVSSVVDLFLGDIVIATGVAGRQARDAGHSDLTELRILALHGLLHLLGYDHEEDAGLMRRVERRLRRRGGLREGLIERGRAARPARQ